MEDSPRDPNLPRINQTAETIMDTRETRSQLKKDPQGSRVIMISNNFHLQPRITLISYLEGFPLAKMLSAEDIYKGGWPDRDHKKLFNKVTPPKFLLIQTPIELALSTAIALDGLTNTQFMRKIIASQAQKRRVTQGKQY